MKFNLWKIGTIVIAGILLVGIGVFLAKFMGNGQQSSQTPSQQSNSSLLSDIIPWSKPTPNPAASDALKELRKMSGAVEMGLNLQEYTKRMIDMKAEVDEKLSQVPDGELKQEIKVAQQAYIDAKTLWNASATYDNVYTSGENGAIFKKYGIPAEGATLPSAPKKVALSLVWAAADKHIEKATNLNNKK